MAFVAHGSASLAGDVNIARRRINQSFLRRFIEHFEQHGEKVIARVAEEQPGTYLKCLCLLMPKESRIEVSNPTGKLSDEQLALMVSELEQRIASRLSGEDAKVIPHDPERDGHVAPKTRARWKYNAKRKAAKAIASPALPPLDESGSSD